MSKHVWTNLGIRKDNWCRAGLLAFFVVTIFNNFQYAQSSNPGAKLQGNEPGLAVENDRLLVALPLVNLGAGPAADVRLTRISLRNQELLRPETLPLVISDLAAGAEVVLQLAFAREGLLAGKKYHLFLEGTLRESGHRNTPRHTFVVTRTISIPPPNEGRRTIREARVAPHTVDGADFPPTFLEPRFAEEPGGRPLPEGTGEIVLEPDNPAVVVSRAPAGIAGSAGARLLETREDVSFIRASSELLTFKDTKGGAPWDPSGASLDFVGAKSGIVFLTGNLYGLLSTDGGSTFTHLDPTTIFGNIPSDGIPADEGLCCDMNLIYVPSIDRFVWLLMTKGSQIGTNDKGDPINGYNRLRVASASPQQAMASGGTAWTYWDMTTALFGFEKQAFLDYPDISFTDKFLHISVVRPDFGGFFVIRVPLTDVQNGGIINIGFTDPNDGKKAAGARLAHDALDGAYWFGHDTTKYVQIFEWLDNSNIYTWRTREVDGWNDKVEDYESITPDGTDWLFANTSAIRGATYLGKTTLGDTFLIAWNAARGGGFPHPYVRMVPITKWELLGNTMWSTGKSKQIWNDKFAFHHAHLATNSNGEVGVSVGAGGGGSHATPVAGFVRDLTLYVGGVSTASLDRYGDYTAIRPHQPNTRLFSVSDYFLQATAGGGFTVMHQYRLFGRPGDAF